VNDYDSFLSANPRVANLVNLGVDDCLLHVIELG